VGWEEVGMINVYDVLCVLLLFSHLSPGLIANVFKVNYMSGLGFLFFQVSPHSSKGKIPKA
jgi:hypothetical protein